MNLTIKTIEEIGQNLSIKQFNDIDELKEAIGINEELNSEIPLFNQDMMCVMFPEDDSEDDSNKESEEEDDDSDSKESK